MTSSQGQHSSYPELRLTHISWWGACCWAFGISLLLFIITYMPTRSDLEQVSGQPVPTFPGQVPESSRRKAMKVLLIAQYRLEGYIDRIDAWITCRVYEPRPA